MASAYHCSLRCVYIVRCSSRLTFSLELHLVQVIWKRFGPDGVLPGRGVPVCASVSVPRLVNCKDRVFKDGGMIICRSHLEHFITLLLSKQHVALVILGTADRQLAHSTHTSWFLAANRAGVKAVIFMLALPLASARQNHTHRLRLLICKYLNIHTHINT